jgi:hypothetical protein
MGEATGSRPCGDTEVPSLNARAEALNRINQQPVPLELALELLARANDPEQPAAATATAMRVQVARAPALLRKPLQRMRDRRSEAAPRAPQVELVVGEDGRAQRVLHIHPGVEARHLRLSHGSLLGSGPIQHAARWRWKQAARLRHGRLTAAAVARLGADVVVVCVVDVTLQQRLNAPLEHGRNAHVALQHGLDAQVDGGPFRQRFTQRFGKRATQRS